MKTFLLTYPPLERPINFEYDYLIKNEPEEDIWTTDLASWEAKTSIPFRQLRYPERSITVKHLNAYQQILNDDLDFALILEDDVILSDNFRNILDKMLSLITDWDLLFIGSGCNLRMEVENGKYWYKKDHPATKCVDSYLIKNNAAKKILSELPFTLPIDWELNYILQKYDMNVYWLEPPIAVQGSQNGTFKSSIQCT